MGQRLSLDETKNIGDFISVNWEDEHGITHPGIEVMVLYIFRECCCVEGDMLTPLGAVFSHHYNYQKYLHGTWPGAYYNFNQQEDVWVM